MIGFITTPEIASTVLNSIKQVQIDNGRPHYWTTGAEPIYTGDHAGQMFIPASDNVLDTPLRNGLTPRDFPDQRAAWAALASSTVPRGRSSTRASHQISSRRINASSG